MLSYSIAMKIPNYLEKIKSEKDYFIFETKNGCLVRIDSIDSNCVKAYLLYEETEYGEMENEKTVYRKIFEDEVGCLEFITMSTETSKGEKQDSLKLRRMEVHPYFRNEGIMSQMFIEHIKKYGFNLELNKSKYGKEFSPLCDSLVYFVEALGRKGIINVTYNA